jgi:predicted membrane channel-forming protein YqfA (hemolysin III family)
VSLNTTASGAWCGIAGSLTEFPAVTHVTVLAWLLIVIVNRAGILGIALMEVYTAAWAAATDRLDLLAFR